VALSLSSHRDGTTVTVAVDGDIDLSTADELEHAIAAPGAGPTTDVIVDLSAVRFIDSAGINALLKGRRQADAHGRSFRVSGAAGLVRELLEITGVLAHLTDPTG
jgi:anti-sigma B factor antagonist